MKERGRRLSISFGRFLIIIIFYFTDFLFANIAFVYFLFFIFLINEFVDAVLAPSPPSFLFFLYFPRKMRKAVFVILQIASIFAISEAKLSIIEPQPAKSFNFSSIKVKLFSIFLFFILF